MIEVSPHDVVSAWPRGRDIEQIEIPSETIVPWAEPPALARGMYEATCEAYPDIPGLEEDETEAFTVGYRQGVGRTHLQGPPAPA